MSSIYQGTKRKLLLSFDVGARYSGISYRYARQTTLLMTLAYHGRISGPLGDISFLEPGKIPVVMSVTRLVHEAHCDLLGC